MLRRKLYDSFLERAAVTPNASALRIDANVWTYASLASLSAQWAATISAGCPAQRIVLLTERSVISYLGILSILRAGAAYVPVSGRAVSRLRSIIEDCAADAIIASEKHRRLIETVLTDWSGYAPVVFLASEQCELTQSSLGTIGATVTSPHAELDGDLAYIMYTSGSTGRPKGVPVTHANVTAFLNAVYHRYDFSAHDRFSQTFELTFDLSIMDLFAAWSVGACVCVPGALDLLMPAAYVNRYGITVWFSVPSVIRLSDRAGRLRAASMPTLRWSLFCGDVLTRQDARTWNRAAPAARMENLYGPTECTVACSAYRVTPEDLEFSHPASRSLPIGELFVGTIGRIERGPDDDEGVGELWLSGEQRVHHYWRRPEESSRAFVDVEDDAGVWRKWYRTGDRVEMSGAHGYTFLGRRDSQIKLNGYRIELSEVAGQLDRVAGNSQSIVLAWPLNTPEFLLGVCVGPPRPFQNVRDALTEALPFYMIPKYIFWVETLQYTANGKVDIAWLQQKVTALLAETPALTVRLRLG